MQRVSSHNLIFLQGGGEMGALTRNFDWSTTPVGHPEIWPQSLRTTVSNLLRSKFPMFLWWGDEMIQFYNDAYRPSMGSDGKHPSALGQQGKECWPEIWDIISPLHEQVRQTGEATWMEDQLVPIYRNGKIEDVYWTYSYSSVLDDAGKHAGILVTCTETTEKVLNFRKLKDSEDSLRFAIEATELATWEYDPATNIITGNHRLKEWFGLAAEDAISLDLALNVVAEADRKRVATAITTALRYESGGLYDIEYRIIHPQTWGERIVRAKGRAWYGPDKQCYRFNGTLQDITPQFTARKNAEESAQQVRSLIESAPFPIGVYIGREMRITLLNQAIIEVWGKGSDILGKRYAEVLPELEDQHIYEQLDRVYTTGIPFHARHQRVDLVVGGQLRPFYFNYSFTPLYDGDGNIYGVMNTAADVTDLVEAKQKVEQSEQRFHNLIRGSSVGIVVLLGEEMIVSVVNAAYGRLIGRTVDEMLNQPLFDLIPDAEASYRHVLDRVRLTGQAVFLYDTPYLVYSNDVKIEGYLNVVYQPYYETDGRITGVMALCQDVTEQVLSRKKIKEVEERARLAIAAAELGTFDVDLATNHIVTSARLNEIFEVDELGERTSFVDRVHPDDLATRQKAYEESFRTGLLEYEARIIRKNGQLRWFRAKGCIFFDDHKKPVKLAGVVQDITEEKRFAEELTRQVKERTNELERSNEELQQFAHVASHDLKEPVRKILTFNSRLITEFDPIFPDKAKRYLQKIERSANRIYTMIEGVLLYSSMNALVQPDEPVDLNSVISDIQDDLELLIQQKGAVLRSEPLPVIQGARVLLYQLFYNLLNNSLKFSSNTVTPLILIRANITAGSAIISIEDNGIGFNQQHAEDIFDTFTRLHSRDQYEGTGLGLALCKKIVERHGGSIGAAGKEGEGAVFTITLPVEQA